MFRHINRNYDRANGFVGEDFIEPGRSLHRGKILLLGCQNFFVEVADKFEAAPFRRREIADEVFAPVPCPDYRKI
jgi:hypothetical protein